MTLPFGERVREGGREGEPDHSLESVGEGGRRGGGTERCVRINLFYRMFHSAVSSAQ